MLPLGKDIVANGEPKPLTSMRLNASYPAWMPDGKAILFSELGRLWRLPLSGNPGEHAPEQLPFVGEDGQMPIVSHPKSAGTSRLIYVRSFTDWNIWSVKTPAPGLAASVPPAVAIASTRTELTPAFSPDGRRVAFASDRSGYMEIWTSDPDGSNAQQLTFMNAASVVPGWSPDGQLIAFHCNVEKQYEIYVIPASGGKPRRLTYDPLNDGFPSFSRDGKWIYFGSNRAAGAGIWKVSVSGGDAVQITHGGDLNPLQSPDGIYLYYTRGPAGSGSLWRIPVSGGEPVQVLDRLFNVNFAVTEKGIYYTERTTGETRLRFLDLANGRSTTVADNLGEVAANVLTVSPDGLTILYVRKDSSVNDLMLVENFH